MNSLSDMTPILSKRESRGGVGAEESSDDEMGSVSFQKKYFVNRCHVKKPFFFPAANIRQKSWRQQWSFIIYFNYFFCDVSSKCYGTPKVCILCYICQLLVYIFWFHEFMNFRSSTPQSDTDQSDDDEDDDISDHDLTPCKICLYIFFVSLPVCLQLFWFQAILRQICLDIIGDLEESRIKMISKKVCVYSTPSIIFFRQLFIFALFIISEILYLFIFFRLEKSCTKSQWWSQ